MATHDYYRLQQGSIPNMKPGANAVWIRVDFRLMPGAAGDTYNLMEVNNHWIVKHGFYRVTYDGGVATATFDVQAVGANDMTAAIDIDRGDDVMTRFTAVDDDAPVAITADGFITGTLNTKAAGDGVIDLFFVIVVAPGDEEITNLGE